VEADSGQDTRRPFYARLPAATYRQLRRLAGLPPVKVPEKRKPFLVRLPEPSYERLRKIAVARSTSSGRIASMRSVLVTMIDDCAGSSLDGCEDMLAVVVSLIDRTPIRPQADSPRTQPRSP
jgi:hypothetical protein